MKNNSRFDNIHLDDLRLQGKFIFNYFDKVNFYFLYIDEVENNCNFIMTDKDFFIENIYDIHHNEKLAKAERVFFTKPMKDQFNDFVFKGFIYIDNEYYKFTIENFKLEVEDTPAEYRSIENEIEFLKNFDISFFIQKKNLIYLVGYDKKVEEDVFLVYDMVKNKIKYLNSFYGDDCVYYLQHFCFAEDKIVICGYKFEEKIHTPFYTFIRNAEF